VRFNRNEFDFVRASRHFFLASAIITVLGIASLIIFGLNYGIDFRSGTSMDISVHQKVSKDQVDALIHNDNLGEYTLTEGTNRLSIRFKNALSEQQMQQFQTDFKKLDPSASFETNIVDVDIAREQQRNALYGVALASVGIMIYVAIRFEWRFAIAAIIALLHDAFIVISLFSIFRLEVNLPFIVAVLTIIGYSINDTVVIFDRIRENLRFAKIKSANDLAAVVNESVRQTLTRSINTVLTVAFAAVCLFAFGSPSIRLFSLAMIFGLISGAYSSIFIASPLWLLLRRNAKTNKPAKARNAT
jgi:SecD/SecF fusion protein